MSKCLSFLFTLLLLGALGLAAAGWWINNEFKKDGVHSDIAQLPFIVESGQGTNIIAKNLHKRGFIEHPFIFTFGVRAFQNHTRLKAGEYNLQPGVSPYDIMMLMVKGKTVTRNITIREGLTNFEIMALLRSQKLLEQDESELLSEGLYLPETYQFALGDSTDDILERMHKALNTVLAKAWENRAVDLPFETKEEALVLASIIEKETSVPSERRRVAGVFVNRLRKAMLLQTDPTVIYALNQGRHQNNGKGPLGRQLLRKDLKVDSPYNTYKYPGLPPTPIANPGKASIEAAVNPEEHDYLFFVADGTGGHIFSKTLAEHNRAVARWRKIRAAQ